MLQTSCCLTGCNGQELPTLTQTVCSVKKLSHIKIAAPPAPQFCAQPRAASSPPSGGGVADLPGSFTGNPNGISLPSACGLGLQCVCSPQCHQTPCKRTFVKAYSKPCKDNLGCEQGCQNGTSQRGFETQALPLYPMPQHVKIRQVSQACGAAGGRAGGGSISKCKRDITTSNLLATRWPCRINSAYPCARGWCWILLSADSLWDEAETAGDLLVERWSRSR